MSSIGTTHIAKGPANLANCRNDTQKLININPSPIFICLLYKHLQTKLILPLDFFAKETGTHL